MALIKSLIELSISPIIFILIVAMKLLEHQRHKDNNALDLDKIILNN